MRTTLTFIVAAGLGAIILFEPPKTRAQTTCQPPTPTDVVISPNPPKDECDPGSFPIDQFDAFSWQSFIALNWPATSGQRGTPDTTKTITDRTAPRVWETWKSVEEVYAPDGKMDGTPPKDWVEAETNKICKNVAELSPLPTKILADLNQGDDELTDQGLNVIGPLVAQNRTYVRYEVRMNKVEFDAIKTDQLYLRAKLPAKDPDGAESSLLPNGVIDVKAAWREVKEGENTDRYYQTEALAIDPVSGRCDKRRFVLIGFHLAQKTLQRPQWIWSTFEHVDNIAVEPGAPVGTKSSLNDPSKPQTLGANPGPIDANNPPMPDPDPIQVVALNQIRPETQATNAKWRNAPEIRNTVWHFYKLVHTQWPIEPSSSERGNPFPSTKVANLTMETYRQANTCITCHARTAHRTDFVWFLSNRAHPVNDSVKSNAKVLKDHSLLSPQ
jgi:hypothetical protein